MLNNRLILAIVVFGIVQIFYSCAAKKDDPGLEYAPNMYHSVPYEPLTQITDEDAGQWLSTRIDGKGEYFNTNINNPYHMNERVPPAGTVRRTKDGFLPYRIPKDSIDLASRILKNPLDSTAEIVNEGKVLFSRFCQHCHGETGQGDGKVGLIYKGVPAYNQGQTKDLTEGHIFHVITYGIRRMGAHGSQIDIEDRWKIVRYVQTLQNQ